MLPNKAFSETTVEYWQEEIGWRVNPPKSVAPLFANDALPLSSLVEGGPDHLRGIAFETGSLKAPPYEIHTGIREYRLDVFPNLTE